MYFVDREKMDARLTYFDKQIQSLEAKKTWNQTEWEMLAYERICHLCIEIILDVGNAIIDGFIMRDPGSYDDIIDILLDEKVIMQEDADGLKEVIALRKVVVQEYLEVNHDELLRTMGSNLKYLKSFPANVRRYVEKELGPVTAFKPLQ
ncbi:DUF86 domain-containing protein [Metabacillus malikii]|uniref:Uncharacterized protein YutE (UPF0331/DUF86 family) n=1 Tax=Metabacillus malikii TaxID=1504265 RepID=A0ABT9ZCI3_9BACI|nr:DUF86 domain-containing protein [Metabacillus malikii]MDQ0229725.1 uncharacterized protein YutE (UPF0331/DUF86 family) [Metabacillus malikii]